MCTFHGKCNALDLVVIFGLRIAVDLAVAANRTGPTFVARLAFVLGIWNVSLGATVAKRNFEPVALRLPTEAVADVFTVAQSG